jgi:hypothetical protein
MQTADCDDWFFARNGRPVELLNEFNLSVQFNEISFIYGTGRCAFSTCDLLLKLRKLKVIDFRKLFLYAVDLLVVPVSFF